jgi:hypothetical protein
MSKTPMEYSKSCYIEKNASLTVILTLLILFLTQSLSVRIREFNASAKQSSLALREDISLRMVTWCFYFSAKEATQVRGQERGRKRKLKQDLNSFGSVKEPMFRNEIYSCLIRTSTTETIVFFTQWFIREVTLETVLTCSGDHAISSQNS